MIDDQTFVMLSLESHLFNGRQMKEHAIFFLHALPSKEKLLKIEAEEYKTKFENLLQWVVRNSSNRLSANVLASHEFVTELTARAEQKTQELTGIAIDSSITAATAQLQSGMVPQTTQALVEHMKFINQATIKLLDSYIKYQEDLAHAVKNCQMELGMYPTMVNHLVNEAKSYRQELVDLEHGVDIRITNPLQAASFWTHVMEEHAAFVRGLLDPMHVREIEMADEFAAKFGILHKQLEDVKKSTPSTNHAGLLNVVRTNTMELQQFKTAATEGILSCKVHGLILPLLGDHILREANHLLRMLSSK